MSRRKRKKQKEIAIYLNNKPIPQVNRLKYLGIINKTKLNSVVLVRTRTIPTERPPPVGEVSANFCG